MDVQHDLQPPRYLDVLISFVSQVPGLLSGSLFDCLNHSLWVFMPLVSDPPIPFTGTTPIQLEECRSHVQLVQLAPVQCPSRTHNRGNTIGVLP